MTDELNHPSGTKLRKVTVFVSSPSDVQAEREAVARVLAHLNTRPHRTVWRTGQTFLMGSHEGEGLPDEQPSHQVTVSPFFLHQHSVTNEEYRRFDPDHEFSEDLRRHPVTRVNWCEAMAYAAWLGGCLPTEAQWELAARGTEGRTFPWGEHEPTPKHARFRSRSTVPVGSLPKGRTPEGVDDLTGNVWEWCRDWYGDYPSEEQTDPAGPATGPSRVLRGGAFSFGAKFLRGAYRYGSPPGYRVDGIGFRVVWSSSGGLS